MRSFYLNLLAKDRSLRGGNYCSITHHFKYCTGQGYVNSDTRDYHPSEVECKQDKSRLSPAHRNILNNLRPYNVSHERFHETVKYKARLYGTYGEMSGINPRICWPTHKELSEIKEYESVAYPFTLEEMIKTNNEAKAKKAAVIKEREEEISANLEKLEKWKEELKLRIEKKEAEAMANKARRERLVEEVRRFFGFKVDPREERFKEMLEKKEKEDRKLEKQAKKKAREAKALEKLNKMSLQASENIDKPSV